MVYWSRGEERAVHRWKLALEVILRRRDMTRASLAGRDLRGANLRCVDLSGADLKGTNLRGADLRDADMAGCLLHGADLRETLVGNSCLDHRGGDPELTWIYNPEVWNARADDETRWPEDFTIYGAGIIFDGPELRRLEGEVVKFQLDPQTPGRWGRRRAPQPQGLVREVRGGRARIQTDAGAEISVFGQQLLANNLRLLRGERAFHLGQWWSIVGHDDEQGTLEMEHGDLTEVVRAQDLFEDNFHRWWWHIPGSEYTARS